MLSEAADIKLTGSRGELVNCQDSCGGGSLLALIPWPMHRSCGLLNRWGGPGNSTSVHMSTHGHSGKTNELLCGRIFVESSLFFRNTSLLDYLWKGEDLLSVCTVMILSAKPKLVSAVSTVPYLHAACMIFLGRHFTAFSGQQATVSNSFHHVSSPASDSSFFFAFFQNVTYINSWKSSPSRVRWGPSPQQFNLLSWQNTSISL